MTARHWTYSRLLRNARTAWLGKWPMLSDWNQLSDDLQLVISRAALDRAAETIAGQAEILAREIEDGALRDRGGPEALRLLARIVRLGGDGGMTPAGHA
jgi:hypothetical protein